MPSLRFIVSLPFLLLGLAFMWIALSICDVLDGDIPAGDDLGPPLKVR